MKIDSNNTYFRFFWLIFVSTFVLMGCLENPSISSLPKAEPEDGAQILTYLDNTGYYRSNEGEPNLKGAYEIYLTSEKYHIIDLREHNKYVTGHITGAVNITTPELIDYIAQFNDSKNILFVCENGALSSYINCMMGMYGFDNLFTLKYGMASWNRDFASKWTDNCKWYYYHNEYRLDDRIYPNPRPSYVPAIDHNEGYTVENRVQNRIRQILQEDVVFGEELTNPSTIFFHFTSMYSYFDYTNLTFPDFEIVCYGLLNLYRLYGKNGAGPEIPAHPYGTLWFNAPIHVYPYSEWNIQMLPANKPILIYSTDGHDSAFLTAFLRVVGYDAKSMLYGVNAFGWNRMLNHEDERISEDAFHISMVVNFPYITGELP